MGRQESPQLIERKTQVDTDAQETSRASKYNPYSDKATKRHIRTTNYQQLFHTSNKQTYKTTKYQSNSWFSKQNRSVTPLLRNCVHRF